MNWSAICWYQLHLIVTHHRSDSIVHGVTSCRKYSLENHAMARASGIMQNQVYINPNRNPQRGHTKTLIRLAPTINIRGWPVPPEKNGSSPQTHPYPDGWSTTGWFKRNIMNGVPGGNLCRPEVNAITDIAELGGQQVATKTLQSCGLKRCSAMSASCWESRLVNPNWMRG